MTSAEIIYEMETRLLLNMIRLLSKGAVGSAEWQAKKLAELGNIRDIHTAIIKNDLREAINAAMSEISARGESAAKQVERGIPEEKLSEALPPDADPMLARIWETWQKTTSDQLSTIGSSLLLRSQQMYVEAVYKAMAAQLAGQITGRQAIAETATEWARAGIPALVDKAGRHWTPEAYAATVVRANTNNVARATQDERFDQFGQDLVQVSSHAGSRPEHIPFQGRIYSRSGTSEKYPPLSETGYGEVDGIGGINCSHFIYAYQEGDKKAYEPYPVAESKEVYAQSQKQRAIERSIRAAKRELTLLDPVKEQAAIALAKERVANRQKAMRDFIDETGRTRRRDREQIYQ